MTSVPIDPHQVESRGAKIEVVLTRVIGNGALPSVVALNVVATTKVGLKIFLFDQVVSIVSFVSTFRRATPAEKF
jgi:hypothetical protein